MYRKGQLVKVWSLQSFHGGGFLNGAEAVVRQDQVGDSVILAVVRNMDGTYKLDKSYEVYAKQCEPLEEEAPLKDDSFVRASKELKKYRQKLLDNDTIR